MREYTQKEPSRTAAAFYGLLDTPPIATIPPQQRARLETTLWPRIAERARHESLRDLAIAYGVSYEMIRTVVRRVRAAERTTIGMAAD